jgi:hypothetical protein
MKALGVTLLALLTVPFVSVEAAETGESIGIGANLCAQLAKEHADNPAGADEVYWPWAMGMMSGLNFASVANSKYFRDLSGDQELFRRAIFAYCQRHPLASYSGAILDLYVSLPLKKAAR